MARARSAILFFSFTILWHPQLRWEVLDRLESLKNEEGDDSPPSSETSISRVRTTRTKNNGLTRNILVANARFEPGNNGFAELFLFLSKKLICLGADKDMMYSSRKIQ
jgi:hypothetical protein